MVTELNGDKIPYPTKMPNTGIYRFVFFLVCVIY